MTALDFIAIFVFFSALSYGAFLFAMWLRINGFNDDEKDTFDYQQRELNKRFGELKQAIGEPLLPILHGVIDKLREGSGMKMTDTIEGIMAGFAAMAFSSMKAAAATGLFVSAVKKDKYLQRYRCRGERMKRKKM